MNIYALLTAGILSLMSAQSLACSCSHVVGDMSPEEKKQEWLEGMAADSDMVVLALVTSVAAYKADDGDAGQIGVLEIREILKGQPPPTIAVKTGMCQDFPLKTDEERVFFIVSEGRVRPCSDYRHAMSDEEVAMRLRGSANLTHMETTAIGYASVSDALNALKGKPSVIFSVQDGWTMAEDTDVPEIWMFVPVNHPAYPTVIKGSLVKCEASQEICDRYFPDKT